MITVITAILGALTGILPGIVEIFSKKVDLQHEKDLLQIRVDANLTLEEAKAAYREGESLRRHDTSIDGGWFFNALRASIRPVITYVFFAMFVVIKSSAAYIMINNGMSIPEMLSAVWDDNTSAIFGAIMGFWFGSRAIEKYRNNNNKE
jgi:hypothetical protein